MEALLVSGEGAKLMRKLFRILTIAVSLWTIYLLWTGSDKAIWASLILVYCSLEAEILRLEEK